MSKEISGVCPQCKRSNVQALHGGLCYYHSIKIKKVVKGVEPIAQASEKQSKMNKAYSSLASAFKAVNPVCVANLEGCTKKTEDIHHRRGRGINMLDSSTWLAVCRSCHTYIELHPVIAKYLGLSESRLSK